jgi:hypothetical protein
MSVEWEMEFRIKTKSGMENGQCLMPNGNIGYLKMN